MDGMEPNGWFVVHLPVQNVHDPAHGGWQEPVIVRSHADGTVSVLVEDTPNQRRAGAHACDVLSSIGEQLRWS